MNTASSESSSVRVWDLPVRVFHWTLAASFAGAYVLGETEKFRNVHVMFGYTVLGLIAFRFLWGFIGTRYARFSSFLFGPGKVLAYVGSLVRGRPEHHVGHNPLGSYAVYAMLALGVLTGVSGYCTLNEIGGEAFEEVHEVAANLWLTLVIVHVAGVIFSSFMHRENLLRGMITGYKQAAAPQQAEGRPVASSPARVGVGILAALAVLTFWVGSLLTGGPSVPRPLADSTVAGEREGDDD